MDSKENKEIKDDEIKDESCAKPIQPENKKDQNISKINKILSDSTTQEKVFDLLFVIDATGSMGNYIKAAKDETENISKELRTLYPEYNFQYGYVFYRDPIDSHGDIHEIINLTDQVNTLPEQIKKIKANGGGDLPEDWVGAYKLVNEKINWRNGIKVIIHLADAGAHGKEFTLSDKYPEEGDKLKAELLKCSQIGIKIFGYVITEDARNSFNQCQNYYRSNGGNYEICEFKISESYSDSDSDSGPHSLKKRKKKCKKRPKKSCKKEELFKEDLCEKYERKEKKCKIREKDSDEGDEDMDACMDYDCDKKCKRKSKRTKRKSSDSEDDKSEKDSEDSIEDKKKKKSSKQKNINSEFKIKVLYSVKSAIP